MNAKGEWQLAKLTLNYCQFGGSSRGVRKFLRYGLTDFANANPQVLITAQPRNYKHPSATGHYINNKTKSIGLRKMSPKEVTEVVNELRNTSGRKMTKINYIRQTETPSVQGEWRAGVATQADVKIEGDL
jgi:large subunit ribosomal protein L43